MKVGGFRALAPALARGGRLSHAEITRLAKHAGLPPPCACPHSAAGGYGLWQVTPAARAFDPLENMKAAAAIAARGAGTTMFDAAWSPSKAAATPPLTPESLFRAVALMTREGEKAEFYSYVVPPGGWAAKKGFSLGPPRGTVGADAAWRGYTDV